MSTEIKNTLFRFVTMRAPELIEQDQVIKSFVQHPEIGKPKTETFFSAFLTAIYNIPSGKTKKQFLIETASNFTANYLEDREAVKALVGADNYDFAIWLTSNRGTFTYDDIRAKIEYSGETLRQSPLTSFLTKSYKTTLWDNLFYQIITFKSSYAREAILSVLVADFFLNNYQTLGDKIKELQKLAQARVIIPSDLFHHEDNSSQVASRNSVLSNMPLSTKQLDKELEINLVSKTIAFYNNALDEIKKAEKIYEIENQKALLDAKKRYDQTVADLYANAETIKRTIIDPVTHLETTYTEYVNLVIPAFEFEPRLEIDTHELSFKLSKEVFAFVSEIAKSNALETFEKLKSTVSDLLDVETKKLFENAKLSSRSVNANGVLLQEASRPNSNSVNGFSISGTSYSGTTPLTLLFNNLFETTDVVQAAYAVTFNDATSVSGTSFEEEWVNNKLQTTLFTEGLNVNGKSTFIITGEFLLSYGAKVHFTGSGVISKVFLANRFRVIGNGTFETELLLDDVENPIESQTGEVLATTNVIDYMPSGYGIKRLGIADYRKVEQEVCCYVPGEVSHIENIMAREYKEKSTRRLRRQEDTTTTSREKETEKLSDTTSTERFEMNQEVSSVLAEQNSSNYHAGIRWNGKISGEVGADFSNNTSQEESNSQAVTNAKEVTERALDRVVLKIKEERVTKIIEEFEENNKHGYDNRKGDQHISGVYRWVDKIFKNRVVNYGKRLMYEFMIPEPAAFHNAAIDLITENPSTEILIKPIDPRVGDGNVKIKTPNDITVTNYQHWAAVYNAEVIPLKEDNITVGESFKIGAETGSKLGYVEADSGNGKIKIPEGYYAFNANGVYNAVSDNDSNGGRLISLTIGNLSDRIITTGKSFILTLSGAVNKYVNEIPVSFTLGNHVSGDITASVSCKLTEESKKQWQVETFNAIISAYENRLSEFNEKQAEIKTATQTKVKSNPLFYRQIENTVLRKNCIEYLVSHDVLGQTSMLSGSTVQNLRVKYDDIALEAYVAKVKFFEQAFEWDLMSYYFYPFYWAEKSKWKSLYNVDENDDATFRAFLQSGMARVILTVRPGFEEAVNWYMATGQVWNGGQVPTMDDPLFVSIIEELREVEGEIEETWESRVPTSLTVIQAGSIGLNVEGLPCDEECEDNLLFDSDGNPALDENGNQINIIGQNPNTVLLGNVTEDLDTVTESIEEIKTDIEEIKAILNADSAMVR